MENQFILRLPSDLQHIDLNQCTFTKVDDKNVILKHNDILYNGIITRPPTVIETHKIIDSKLYKISDIRSIVVISDLNSDLNETNLHESNLQDNGNYLTHPMKYAATNRFKKYEMRLEMVEEIERQVNELLLRDSQALKVEIKHQEDEEIEEMAADLEQEFEEITNYNENKEKEVEENNSANNAEIAKLSKQIKEKEELVEKTTNPILKKRFKEELNKMEEELKKIS